SVGECCPKAFSSNWSSRTPPRDLAVWHSKQCLARKGRTVFWKACQRAAGAVPWSPQMTLADRVAPESIRVSKGMQSHRLPCGRHGRRWLFGPGGSCLVPMRQHSDGHSCRLDVLIATQLVPEWSGTRTKRGCRAGKVLRPSHPEPSATRL